MGTTPPVAQKIVFLDLDGVLITHLARCEAGLPPGGLLATFDPHAVAALKTLCRKHEAKIVVISTCADDGEDEARITHAFRENGLAEFLYPDTPGKWKRTADSMPGIGEGYAHTIHRWLEMHSVELSDCVILNDGIVGERDDPKTRAFITRTVATTNYDGWIYECQHRLADELLSGTRWHAPSAAQQNRMMLAEMDGRLSAAPEHPKYLAMRERCLHHIAYMESNACYAQVAPWREREGDPESSVMR